MLSDFINLLAAASIVIAKDSRPRPAGLVCTTAEGFAKG